MNLTTVSPFFIVADLGTSIAYYVDKHGFQVDFQGPPDDVYYAGVSPEGKEIARCASLYRLPAGGGVNSLRLRVPRALRVSVRKFCCDSHAAAE